MLERAQLIYHTNIISFAPFFLRNFTTFTSESASIDSGAGKSPINCSMASFNLASFVCSPFVESLRKISFCASILSGQANLFPFHRLHKLFQIRAIEAIVGDAKGIQTRKHGIIETIQILQLISIQVQRFHIPKCR